MAFVTGLNGTKQGATKKPRPPVSQPVDADDLRRRLYVVISERNAASDKRRLARAGAEAKNSQGPDLSKKERAISAARNGLPSNPTTSQSTNISAAGRTSVKIPTTSGMPDGAVSGGPDAVHGFQDLGSDARATSKLILGTSTDIPTGKAGYHHVPQQAASQFAQTATAERIRDKSLIHRLSLHAMKFHMDGDKATMDSTKPTPSQHHALRTMKSQRDSFYDRNRFQDSKILEESFENDVARRLRKRHSMPAEDLGRLAARRISVLGSIPLEEAVEDIDEPTLEETAFVPVRDPNEHRVDWSQSDEIQEMRRGIRGPLHKPAESFRGLREKLVRLGRDSVLSDNSSRTIKPTKSGFFARLRRHTTSVAQ